MNALRTTSHHVEPAIEGEMLVIQPSQQAWQFISAIQKIVGDRLEQEGITTWSPTALEKAHFTLFAGLSNLDRKERLHLMKRVAEKISSFSFFNLQITMNEQAVDSTGIVRKTTVKRGPYKWVTLGLAHDQLKEIRDKVKEAVLEAIENKEIAPLKVDLDKLHKNYGTHLTIGTLDIDECQYYGLPMDKQHPDVKKLNDLNGKIALGITLAEQFKGLHFSSLVHTVSLIGINNLRAKASEKEYYHLGSCPIGQVSYFNAPKSISLHPTIAKKTFVEVLKAAS